MALRQCKLAAACRNDSQRKLLQTLNPKIFVIVIQHDIHSVQCLPPNQKRNLKKNTSPGRQSLSLVGCGEAAASGRVDLWLVQLA